MKSNKAKVSVIVPIYNVEPYLAQCLDCLISQTLSDIEIICVDDCGTDNSGDIAREYAVRDSRIKVIRNERNMGLAASRNNGIKNSSAKYIMFCDSDDWYAPDMCEKMLNAISAHDVDVAVCATNVIYETDHAAKTMDDECFQVRDGIVPVNIKVVSETDAYAWNKIFKREIIETHDVWFPAGLRYEDNYFFHVYCLWARKIAFVHNKLYNYRRRPNSIMSITFTKGAPFAIDHVKISIAYAEYMKKHGFFEQNYDYFWKRHFIGMFYTALNYMDRASDRRDAFIMARRFIKRNYKWGSLDMQTDRTLRMIANMTLDRSRKYLGGIVRVNERNDGKKVRLIGIPVYRGKYRARYSKYYILGMRIVTKRKYIKFPKIPVINRLNVDNTQLLSVLHKLPCFTYIPNSGNLGDMLIAAATLQFFNRNNIKFSRFDGHETLPCVVYGGGGIWTENYECDWIKTLEIFKRAKQVVILPSSFNNCQKLIDALDERFVVFCRERRSYEYLKSANTRAKILLDHDMAFRLDAFPTFQNASDTTFNTFEQVYWKGIPKQAYFMRTDCESAGKYSTDLDVSALAYGLADSTYDWINFCAGLMLAVVASTDRVVTDRLHVAIAGLLCGRDVYMLDNTYGKLSGVYEHSMKQYSNVHLCNELPEF